MSEFTDGEVSSLLYMINKHVGHLGIFVSAKVARLEHRAILEQAKHIAALKPGLYEMIINNPTGNPDCRHDQYKVSFEERRIEDICDIASQAPFEAVRDVSERNDELYCNYIRPWVQAFAKYQSGDTIRQFHPLRLKRIMFSERLNPAMLPLIFIAKAVQENRHKASEDNPYIKMEQKTAERVIAAVESGTALHDQQDEKMFKALYGRSRK